MQKVSGRTGGISTAFINELADLFAVRWDEHLATVPNLTDAALQSGRAAPFAAADLIDAICAVRPDAEVLAFALADLVLAEKLKWPKPVPLLLSERYGPAFRTIGGRGRVRPGEPAFAGAICLALVEAIDSALPVSNGNSTSRRSTFVGCAQNCALKAPSRSFAACCMMMRFWLLRRAPIYPAGQARACSTGFRTLAPCANSPVDRPFGFTGFDDDRSRHSQSISKQGERPRRRSSRSGSWKTCRQICAGGNGCCELKRSFLLQPNR
jgi:hypothetical protein